jgi:hypothetical protein
MESRTKTFKWGLGGIAFLIAAMFIAFGGTRAVGLAHAQTPPSPTAEAATSNEDPTHEANETADQEAAEDSGQGRGGHMMGSNEDPTHEANETADREAAEDSGQGWGGRMHGASNEDPAHEASESAEREAAEDAGQTQQAPSDSATPSN